MKRLILFTGSTGLNTAVDPVRHTYNPDTGISDLAQAKNIDFDITGRPSNRKGWSYTGVATDCHSLFCDGGTCLFVTGDALKVLSSDLSSKAIRKVTVGAKMRYAQIGAKVYYTNEREIGFVRDGVSVAWEKPTTVHNVKDSTKVLNGPPVGSLLEYFNGRMYIVQHNVAWESEQYNVNAYDLGKRFVQMESAITLFKGVQSGVWVGTRNKIIFLRGTCGEDFRYEVKGLFGAVSGTEVSVDGFAVPEAKADNVCILFASKYGPCLGTADGQLIPLTERRVAMPNALNGSGAIINKKYIYNLES